MKLAVIHGSSREISNTSYLANEVTKGIETANIYLKDLTIHQIIDQRHDADGFDRVHDDYDKIVEVFLTHDVVVFATPLYWYGMSGLMKTMFDRFSQAVRDPEYGDELKDKLAQIEPIVLIVGGDHPRMKALPLLQQFGHALTFLNFQPLSYYIVGDAGKPETMKDDSFAIAQANALNQYLSNK
ncbi:flavodoxin family protein [Geomicrobium sediminis]|uniref:Multimeric flavodoxin WrbA n=1 Tax=Geomicrobium sediminis TaxID=1347788 RepID=A0ABS2PA73_9BACL|nr:flavodoxin family protein [Geomicrobium sediminis]MBM7632207.1 multimeric flavodoxin WrbA [Geomicrobium sediminis]